MQGHWAAPVSPTVRLKPTSRKLLIGENVEEMLNADLQAERTARPMYQEAIAYCESVKDYISRELFENILDSEEDHINDLEGGTAELNAINVKPNQAANPPGRPALASPIPMPTLLLAGPGVNWQTATRSA